MRVADRLARREATWRELDLLLRWMDRPIPAPRPRPKAATPDLVWVDDPAVPAPYQPPASKAARIIRLGELYRAACADLMLAEEHDLPRETVAYLHALVARGHDAVYRARGFRVGTWARAIFADVPRRLRADPTLRISAGLFYGVFLAFALLAAGRPGFAEAIAGAPALEQYDRMYAEPIGSGPRDDTLMAGFYIQHNASIGLQCFAWGLSFGLVTLYTLFSNAAIIGTVFGHMATTPLAGNFYTFVTAHGPFELTAIVFSGAAGLRLGWGLIDARGRSRLASLRREALGALPTVGVAVLLFVFAAFLEGFISPSRLPYPAKAATALVSALMLLAYLLLGGRGATDGS